jgi:hypothetical protein
MPTDEASEERKLSWDILGPLSDDIYPQVSDGIYPLVSNGIYPEVFTRRYLTVSLLARDKD